MNMKKLILALLIIAFSTSAMAAWTLIDSNDEFDIYVDIASKRKVGNKVKAWTLYDYKSPQTLTPNGQHLSTARQHEYDCVNETSRFLSFANYTEHMQTGSVVYSFTFKPTDPDVVAILPNSNGESVFKVACGKK